MAKSKLDFQKILAANAGGAAGSIIVMGSNKIIDQLMPDMDYKLRTGVQLGVMEIGGALLTYLPKDEKMKIAGYGLLGAAGYKAGQTLVGMIGIGAAEPGDTIQGSNNITLNASQKTALQKVRNLTGMKKRPGSTPIRSGRIIANRQQEPGRLVTMPRPVTQGGQWNKSPWSKYYEC